MSRLSAIRQDQSKAAGSPVKSSANKYRQTDSGHKDSIGIDDDDISLHVEQFFNQLLTLELDAPDLSGNDSRYRSVKYDRKAIEGGVTSHTRLALA